MKNINAYLLAALLGCVACSQKGDDFSKPFPLEPNMENALVTKWAQKEVLDSLLLEDMEGNGRWEVKKGPVDISYTVERCKDGSQSLRYHMSMLDREHIKANRKPKDAYNGLQGGEVCVALTFDGPQDWTHYNRLSLWVYIHPSKNSNVNLAFDLVDAVNPEETLTPGREMNVDLKQGQWQQVTWEIDYMKRDSIVRFEIWQTLVGYDREMGEQYVTIDFDHLELQRVEPDHYSGWAMPEGQFAFSHIGYRPDDSKVALIRSADDSEFSVVDGKGNAVFTGEPKRVSNKGNTFASLDFSAFNKPGTYTLRYGDYESKPFTIGENVWLQPLFAALNFYFSQRCGFAVSGIHSVCHQDSYAYFEDETKPANGGWHDAGDLSQGFWRTADGCYALMNCLDVVRKDPKLTTLAERIEEEAAWGVSWLLNTRFKGGRHVTWITQRIYSDNEVGTYDDAYCEAVNVSWENFQGTAVFLMAADRLPTLADRKEELLAAAIDNWEQACLTNEAHTVVPLIDAAWGAIASSLLYERFGETRYEAAAKKFGRLVIACQEQTFCEGIPYAGYFYSDTSRQQLQHFSHASFEEVPMLALHALCKVFPEAAERKSWVDAVSLYSNSFLKPGCAVAAPFDLVPNGIYRRADMKQKANESKNYALLQYEAGTQLNEHYALRTFPIWDNYNFHGSTNCHLASAWALAEASTLLNDQEGLDLVQQQLEWIVGRNPFGQSLMYGVGYDFPTMFVYCTHNTVGALTVGIDSFQNDEPYWHPSAYATFKEIWIEPVSRFLGTLAAWAGGKVKD